jgi:hypothetical protein
VGDEKGFFEDILSGTSARPATRATRGRAGGALWTRPCPHGLRGARPRAAPGLLGFSIFVGAIVVMVPVPVAVAALASSPLRTGSGGPASRPSDAPAPDIHEGAAGRDPSVVQSRLKAR